MSSVCLVLGGAGEAGISTVVFVKVQSEAEELQTLFRVAGQLPHELFNHVLLVKL